MAPVPVPVPLHPVLTNAKDTWSTIESLLEWFSKIVDTAYGYSDGLIKFRQKKANDTYKTKKAEKEAYRIMQAQEKKNKGVEKVLGKREWSPIKYYDELVL